MPQKYRCDKATHGESCPQWCDFRPGGATKDPPYSAKATTVLHGDHHFRQAAGPLGVCVCGRVKFSHVHSDYPKDE